MRLTAIALLTLCSCLAHKLKGPAEDHAVIASTVAKSCEEDGYGQGKCTQEDLDAVADQAMCIMAISKAQECVPK